jgi:hypothetical protein
MTIWTHAVVLLAISGAAAAQWPAPSSQPATAPPAAEQPVRSEGGATVTLSGCLSAADPGGATTVARPPGFVLTDVTDLGPQARATDSSGVAAATAHSTSGASPRATRPAERYLLVAADTGLNLSKHANARVKVTGTVNERTSTSAGARDDSRGAPTSSQPGGAGAQHGLSTLTVHSITPAEGTCGR